MTKPFERGKTARPAAPKRRPGAPEAGADGHPDLEHCPHLGAGSLKTWNLNALSLSPSLAVEGNRLASSAASPDSVWFTAATTTLVGNDHGILANLDPAANLIRTWDLDTRLGPLTGIGANFLDQNAGAVWVSAPAAVVHRLDPVARGQLTWALPIDPVNSVIRGLRTLPDDTLAIALQNTAAGPGAILQLNPTSDVVVVFRLPAETSPFGGAVTRDGALFFCEFSTRRIARLDLRSAQDNLTEWQLPDGGNPIRLFVASDGMVWFADQQRVGRLDPVRNRVAFFAKEGVLPQDLARIPRIRRPDLVALADGEPFVDVLCATHVREVSVPVSLGTATQTSTYATPAPSRPNLAVVQSPPTVATVPPVDPAAITRYAAETPTLAVAEHRGAIYASGVNYLEATFRFYRIEVANLYT